MNIRFQPPGLIMIIGMFQESGFRLVPEAWFIKNIPAGTYTLTVTLTGFKEYVAKNVSVTVGNVTRHDVALQIGQLSDTVSVTGAATLLQADTADVHVQLETKEITKPEKGEAREPRSAQIIDLAELLKQSLEQGTPRHKTAGARRSKEETARKPPLRVVSSERGAAKPAAKRKRA